MKPTDQGQPPGPVPGGHAGSSARYDDGVAHHSGGAEDETHNEDVAHEHIDVNLRAIVGSAIVLAVVVAVSQVLVYLMFGLFEGEAAKDDPRPSPLAAAPTQMPNTTNASPYFAQAVKDAPQLMTNEPAALERYMAEQRQRLQTYGWVDQAAGVAHLPIGEAKKLLISRGLPVREGAATAAFTIRPAARGEASGGRDVTAVAAPPAAAVPPAQPAIDHATPTGPPKGGH